MSPPFGEPNHIPTGLDTPPAHVRPAAALALDAAIEGMGVTLAIKPLLCTEIEAKRLVMPFDISVPTSYSYYLVTPEAGAENRALTAFGEWLLKASAAGRD